MGCRRRAHQGIEAATAAVTGVTWRGWRAAASMMRLRPVKPQDCGRASHDRSIKLVEVESCESGTSYYIGHCRSRRTAVSDIDIITSSSKAFTSSLTLDVHFLTLQVFHSASQCVSHSRPILCLSGKPLQPEASGPNLQHPTTSSVPKICSGRPRQPLFLALNARYQPLIDATRGCDPIS